MLDPVVSSQRSSLSLAAQADCESCSATTLPLREVFLTLRTLNDGWLIPWIAPALRGLVLQPLRDHFCGLNGGRELARATTGLAHWQQRTRTPEAQHNEAHTRHYCLGCIKNASCAYGRVFEPDLNIIDTDLIQRGDTQGVRGLSIATAMLASQPVASDTRFPATTPHQPTRQPAGTATRSTPDHRITAPADARLTCRLLAMGQTSIYLLPIVIEAIDAFGRSQGLGYQAPVRFRVDHSLISSHDWPLEPHSLSIQSDGDTLPQVTIQLESPLLLKACFERGRLIPPSFYDLFSNSVRILIRAIREFSDPSFLANDSLADFFAAARHIATHQQSLIAFHQPSLSHRGPVGPNGYRERDLRGWLGDITFENVPAAYLPWLQWAGRLGIGSDRNRGAGLWRVVL